jgi:hypothetical protein
VAYFHKFRFGFILEAYEVYYYFPIFVTQKMKFKMKINEKIFFFNIQTLLSIFVLISSIRLQEGINYDMASKKIKKGQKKLRSKIGIAALMALKKKSRKNLQNCERR